MIVRFSTGLERSRPDERLIGCEVGNEFRFDVEILRCGVLAS